MSLVCAVCVGGCGIGSGSGPEIYIYKSASGYSLVGYQSIIYSILQKKEGKNGRGGREVRTGLDLEVERRGVRHLGLHRRQRALL